MQAILSLILYIGIHNVIALDIDLQHHGLEAIPLDLNTSVGNLNLRDNLITSVEEMSLSNYIQLWRLDIRRNRIHFIHHLAFVHNKRLSSLVVSWNTELAPGEWLTPVRPILREIVVTGIIMDTLEDIRIQEFTNLLKIYASVHCDHGTVLNVKCLPLGLISLGVGLAHLTDVSHLLRLTHLECLYLNHNCLITMPDLFTYPLGIIELNDNQWRCDYDICWLRMWNYFNAPVTVTYPIVCASPVELEGRDIMHTNPAKMGCFEGDLDDTVISYMSEL